ncbi:MAG: hypothetical protein ACKVJG_22855 [Candidatus Latescibacterota bacterium]
MNEEQRQRRRRTFGQTADAYDRVRPGYPPTLIDHLLGKLVSIPHRASSK